MARTAAGPEKRSRIVSTSRRISARNSGGAAATRTSRKTTAPARRSKRKQSSETTKHMLMVYSTQGRRTQAPARGRSVGRALGECPTAPHRGEGYWGGPGHDSAAGADEQDADGVLG